MRIQQVRRPLIRRITSPLGYPERWGLVLHWSGEGPNDSWGSRTLTNNNGATFTAGKVGNAFTLARASSQYLSRASDSGLRTGNVDFWAAAWVNLTSKPASTMDILSRYSSSVANREYIFAWQQSTDRFTLVIEDGFGNGNTVLADALGSPSIATWYFVMAYHDAVNDLLGISVNGGAWSAQVTSLSPPAAATVDATIGARASSTNYWDGKIDEVSFGKSPPFGIATIANEIRDRLWNNGAGRPFPWN